jgi:hypothetical protein
MDLSEWAQAENEFSTHRPLLCHLAEAFCGLMRLKPPSQATKRRPSYRLVIRGDDSHELAVVPNGSNECLLGEPGRACVRVELYRIYTPGGDPNGHKLRREVLRIAVYNGAQVQVRLRRYRPRYFAEDVPRLIRLAQHWLAHPLKPLGDTATHCAICGRSLIDEQSCAQGIGPECVKWAGAYLRAGMITDKEGNVFRPVLETQEECMPSVPASFDQQQRELFAAS